MSEIEIVNEEPITLSETASILEKIKKRDKDVNERGIKTVEYIAKITKKTEKEVKEIREKINKAEIPRLKSKHIVKIIDIMPKDIDSLKTLFTSEPITLKQEELNKVLECLK